MPSLSLRPHLHHIGPLNLDLRDRSISCTGANTAELVDHVHSLDYFTKDGVLAIEVRSWAQGDEELGTIGVGARVCHGEGSFGLVLERRNELVLEFGAEDGAATTTGTGRVTTLNHESRNDSVKDDSIIFSRLGQSSKVLAGAWSLLREELNGNGTESGVQDDLVWVFHSTSWGWGGSSRSTAAAAAAAAAAKHALELVHNVRFWWVVG